MRSSSSTTANEQKKITVFNQDWWKPRIEKLKGRRRVIYEKLFPNKTYRPSDEEIQLYFLSLKNNDYYSIQQDIIHRAICWDFIGEDITSEDLLSEVKESLEKGYAIRIYLDVRGDIKENVTLSNEKLYEAFKAKHPDVCEILNITSVSRGSPVVRLREYMQETRWQDAEVRFNEDRESARKLNVLVSKEFKRLNERYNYSKDEITNHLRNIMITVLSFCNKMPEDNDDLHVENFNSLFYQHGDWIGKYISKCAKNMGYTPWSFVHIQPEYISDEPNKITIIPADEYKNLVRFLTGVCNQFYLARVQALKEIADAKTNTLQEIVDNTKTKKLIKRNGFIFFAVPDTEKTAASNTDNPASAKRQRRGSI